VSAPLADLAALTDASCVRYARDRAYWIGQVVFPLAFIAFIGYGLNDVIALPSGTSYVGHLATGLLAMLVGSGAVGGGFSLIEDKASGFVRALLVAPVSRTHLVLAKLVGARARLARARRRARAPARRVHADPARRSARGSSRGDRDHVDLRRARRGARGAAAPARLVPAARGDGPPCRSICARESSIPSRLCRRRRAGSPT
jgi:hypothetical protein